MFPTCTRFPSRRNWRAGSQRGAAATACSSATRAEANEAAIKLARKHGHQRRGDRPCSVILTAAASFHGRTLAAVTATGQPKYHRGFEPVVDGFDCFPYNDIKAFRTLLEHHESTGPSIAAVLIEPLQGEGGVNPGDPGSFFGSFVRSATNTTFS